MRIGCMGGQAQHVNERGIEDQWTRYLGEFADVVNIPPQAFLKLFGGSIQRWEKRLPGSLPLLAEGLRKLCATHEIDTIYVNMPMLIPYLLLARNHGGLDIGLLFIADSVGSEHWMRQWIGIAPFLTERDVLLVSTESSYQALLNISPRYKMATRLPLCIELLEPAVEQEESDLQLLAISQLEEVQNVEVLLDCFAAIRERVPRARLIIAGEYAGSAEEIAAYRKVIGGRIEQHELYDAIELPGAIVGAEKDACLRQSHLLINLSTDPGETFDFHLIEAKSVGLPVVCTNWGGFADVVKHGVDGLLVDCDWSGNVPVIDRKIVVDSCVRLLTDAALRHQLSEGAKQRAARYDYRVVMPKIVEAVEAARTRVVPLQARETAEMMQAPLVELPHLFELERLQALGVLAQSPLEVLRNESSTPLKQWYPVCKPIVEHFAGRAVHAGRGVRRSRK